MSMPPVHPAADKFPMMGDAELAALAEDIKKNGQRVPVQMIDGAILDGRNRWRACQMAGVPPTTQNWPGTGSPAAYVLSINLTRRHLTPEQRAALAAEFEEMFRQEARIRQQAALKKGDEAPVRMETVHTGRALAQAAAAAGASLDSAQKIKAAAKVDPELLDMAKAGQVKVAEATRLAAMPAPQREEAKAQIKRGERPAPKPQPRAPKAPPPVFDPPLDPEVQLAEDAEAEAEVKKIEGVILAFLSARPKYAARMAQFLMGMMRQANIAYEKRGTQP